MQSIRRCKALTGSLCSSCSSLAAFFVSLESSQNTTITTHVLWPVLGRAINFYMHFLVKNGSTFEVPVTFSPEVRRVGCNTRLAEMLCCACARVLCSGREDLAQMQTTILVSATFAIYAMRAISPHPTSLRSSFALGSPDCSRGWRWSKIASLKPEFHPHPSITSLQIASTYNLTDPNLATWTSIYENLVDYSIDDTGYMIYSNQPYDQPHRHYSHLFAIWPLRSEMHSPSKFGLAAKSLDLWLSTPESEYASSRHDLDVARSPAHCYS